MKKSVGINKNRAQEELKRIRYLHSPYHQYRLKRNKEIEEYK